MQLNQTAKYETLVINIKGLFWVAGLLMAGSDGDFMPWINGFGVLMFFVASVMLGKQLALPDQKTATQKQKKKQRFPFIDPVTSL